MNRFVITGMTVGLLSVQAVHAQSLLNDLVSTGIKAALDGVAKGIGAATTPNDEISANTGDVATGGSNTAAAAGASQQDKQRLSILGIYAGMPLPDAFSIIKRHNPRLQFGEVYLDTAVSIMERRRAKEDQVIGFVANDRPGNFGVFSASAANEAITVLALNNKVYYVARLVRLPAGGEIHPDIFSKGLREKYGAPSTGIGSDRRWVVGARGGQVAINQCITDTEAQWERMLPTGSGPGFNQSRICDLSLSVWTSSNEMGLNAYKVIFRDHAWSQAYVDALLKHQQVEREDRRKNGMPSL